MDFMRQAKVYRNVNTVDKLFGLELVDGCLLLLVFFVAFMFNREGLFVNGAVLAGAYLALRFVKRGKPDGYLLAAGRYVLASRFKRAPGTEEAEMPREESQP